MRDDKSFVSLKDTFHPGDAATVSTSTTERNWNTVFAEAVLVPADDDEEESTLKTQVPEAQTVCVDENEQQQGFPQVVTTITSDPSTDHASLHHFNCMVIILGYAFLINAVAAAFATELAACLTYMLGVGFYSLVGMLNKMGRWTLPLQTLLLLLTALMLAVDLLVLTIGIFLVELIAWIACGTCMLFGGITVGIEWHHHIRRVCHLMRWVFRGFQSSFEPKRMQPFSSDNTMATTHSNTTTAAADTSNVRPDVKVEYGSNDGGGHHWEGNVWEDTEIRVEKK